MDICDDLEPHTLACLCRPRWQRNMMICTRLALASTDAFQTSVDWRSSCDQSNTFSCNYLQNVCRSIHLDCPVQLAAVMSAGKHPISPLVMRSVQLQPPRPSPLLHTTRAQLWHHNASAHTRTLP